jgi:signal transduction histidine kinase/FixJ family two-component response regulator
MLFRSKARRVKSLSRPSLPRGATIGLIAILCVIVTGYDLYHTWQDRSREIEDSQREVANLAWSAAQQAEDAFRLANTTLIGLVERVEVDGTGPLQLERLQKIMAVKTAFSPILQGLTLIDETGNIISSHLPVSPRLNVADRAYFQYHLTHADHLAFTSELLHSRITGKWVIAMSRRVDHANGSFAGIVTATVDIAYFQDFYATFNIGHDGSASLLREDGVQLVRHPFLAAAVGSDQSGSRLFREKLPLANSGTYETRSPFDGVLRIFSYRRVTGYPLVVAVALGKNEALAAWQDGALKHLFAAIMVALLLGFFMVRLIRQLRQLARAEQVALTTNAALDRLARHLGKARDQAEQANQAKSRFLAVMTHELRTPLHGIVGYAELLSLEGALNPTQAERVAAMIAAGEHLLGMINAVLDVSQIEADRLELQPIEVELTGLARACLDVVRPAAEAKGLALVLTETEPLRLFADPTRLRQVLINLLGNAIKFTPSGTVELQLRQSEDGACVRVEVVDTGLGIPATHRDKLFQSFERVNAEAVSGIEGAGLGLALAARLVQLMDGGIGYVDNPNGGSVFWFELPARDAVPAVVAMTALSPLATGPRLRVLVADDEALNRSIAIGFLSMAGHEVVCVDNGIAAVEAAASADFDVILMDVRMPGMNGLEATRCIRALAGPRGQVRIVAVTAQTFGEQIELCRQAGMDSHLSKPFNQAALLAALSDPKTEPSRLALAVEPTAAATADADSSLPVFDRDIFKGLAESLPVADLAGYMQTLITCCEALIAPRRLRTQAEFSELAEDAHRLAGRGGTFGFLSIATAARRVEVAADTADADTAVFAGRLAVAIERSLPLIRQQLADMAVTAT